ncbi:DUF1176 domain-containing protein [Massilia sp. MB5]|uniref:DUF1176 domain-containing protein n=1 Tax=Massilia sp. MB5 TaxID=2919578 RepID=UPI0035A38BCF
MRYGSGTGQQQPAAAHRAPVGEQAAGQRSVLDGRLQLWRRLLGHRHQAAVQSRAGHHFGQRVYGRHCGSFAQGRGLGDCWSHEEWAWDGQQFHATLKRTTGMCRMVALGGPWELPTLVTEVRHRAK